MAQQGHLALGVGSPFLKQVASGDLAIGICITAVSIRLNLLLMSLLHIYVVLMECAIFCLILDLIEEDRDTQNNQRCPTPMAVIKIQLQILKEMTIRDIR